MKRNLIGLTGAILLLCGCNRNDVFGDIEPNTDRVIAEFTDAQTGSFVSRDYSAGPVAVDLTELRFDPRTAARHATKVRVIANPALVNEYNTANGTAYVPVPATAFTLEPSEYVLTPEQRKVMVRAIVRPDALLNGPYAVGLAIAEMSDGEISKIAGNVIVFIAVKNSYDGIYSAKGFSSIPGSAFTGNFNVPCAAALEVATSSDKSVYLSPAQPVYNAGGFVYITNLLPDISFDKTTNKVTAVTARSGSLDVVYPYDATYNSRYDPAAKTIYVKYGVAPAGSGRYVVDTLVFCRAR